MKFQINGFCKLNLSLSLFALNGFIFVPSTKEYKLLMSSTTLYRSNLNHPVEGANVYTPNTRSRDWLL